MKINGNKKIIILNIRNVYKRKNNISIRRINLFELSIEMIFVIDITCNHFIL